MSRVTLNNMYWANLTAPGNFAQLTMEDLGRSGEGRAIGDVVDGFYDATGRIPCQIDGGLKFSATRSAPSGLRML